MREEYRMQLWKEYEETKGPDIRCTLIEEYSYLVKLIAGRLSTYFGSNMEYDDLVGYGVLGLIDAVDKFDIKKGVKFETYATLRIRGAIIDHIRTLDWLPRSIRRKSKAMEKACWELECELGHSVSDEEVASKMGLSINKFNKIMRDVTLAKMVSLEEVVEQNSEYALRNTMGNKEKPEGHLAILEVKNLLIKAIRALPPKERKVISLYYYEGLTLREISVVMGVTESRISQLHTKAVSRLNLKLASNKEALI